MAEFSIPYGKGGLAFSLPRSLETEVVAPVDVPPAPDPEALVAEALEGWDGWPDARSVESAAVAVNDKTRPVPHEVLLPPLLAMLERRLGLPPQAITLLIATGTHAPMGTDEFEKVLPPAVLARYAVQSHECDDRENLVHLGETPRGTPVWINKRFMAADFRAVVGNIEPHQFMGFSGGAKSAAIGLAGRETIHANHAMMTEPDARLGWYADNSVRQDVEDIGQIVGVHFALNAILNRRKALVSVVAGSPRAVMQAGIRQVRATCQVEVAAPFDVVVASPGGHPKDIDLYQAQKALAHAAIITKPGGAVILVAACPEGTGSQKYERWMVEAGLASYEEVIARFRQEGFRIGPHKAFQIARDAARVRVILVSEMPPERVRRLLLAPAASLDEALTQVLPAAGRVGVMPAAASTVPVLQ